MSFTRAFLKSVGLSDEQISAVIEEHAAVVDTLKQKRDEAKAEADALKQEVEKTSDLQTQLDELKKSDYKSKYEQEHADFEAYKADVTKKAETDKLREAYRKLLTDEKINDKRHDVILKVTDFSSMKLDKDGNLQDADTLRKNINDTWSDFKVSTKQRGSHSETPPKEQSGSSGQSIRELAAKWHAEKYGAPKSTEGNGEK